MGRGGDWPPNSFAEWMVGQNFRPKRYSSPEGQKPILKVELSEDEASGDEILAVTYPGRRRRAGAAKQAAAGASGRKVRFDGDRKPLKSALKKSSSSSSSDTTLVETSDEEAASFIGDSSDIDTSEDDARIRQRKGRSKKKERGACKKVDPDDSSAAKDALPHPTCTCNECVKGRKILKAVIKFEAKTRAAEKTVEKQCKTMNKGKQKSKKDKGNDTNDNDGETTEADTTEDEKPSPRDKNKNQKQKQKQKQKTSSKETISSPAAEPPRTAINRDVFKLPEYPKEMKPNLIMRPEARVIQIEHALESPYDPQPNAFYDNQKGITRVYHGPQYANPKSQLYPKYNPEKVATPRRPAGFPAGAIQNPYTTWYASGPPGAMQSFDQNPALFAPIPNNEEAMRKAACQGFGLSGLAPPSVPPYFKEMQKEMARQNDWLKSGSEKGSKRGNSGPSPAKEKDVWQKTGSNKGSQAGNAAWGTTPGWGDDNNNHGKPQAPDANPDAPADPSPQDQNKSGGWGVGGGADAVWGAAKSTKDGGASPHNFGGWGDNNQPQATFQRSSKDGGSQKHGSQKNWNSGGNQTSGGWGDNNNNETAWGATGDSNGEQKPSSNASQAPPTFKPPSSANESPGNGNGGAFDWVDNGNNGTSWGNGSKKAASAGGGDWGQPGDTSNDQNNTWGGPPGSFPRSTHTSRPGSNAGGKDETWGNNGHNNSGNGGESHHPGPNEHIKGVFRWPGGSGPPLGAYNGGRGSRSGIEAGWQSPRLIAPRFGVFSGSQPGRADPPGGDSYFHSDMVPSDWTNKPSDQATGPSDPPDWRNPEAAQNTGGKAMNW